MSARQLISHLLDEQRVIENQTKSLILLTPVVSKHLIKLIADRVDCSVPSNQSVDVLAGVGEIGLTWFMFIVLFFIILLERKS